ncbi:MAG: nickel-dependent lactate racemase [Eubacteriaceae bacterium]|jgi:nickel-dependent lactate racemase
MEKIMRIPYGKTGMEMNVPEGAEILVSRVSELASDKTEDELVLEAMASPIDSPKLSALAQGKKTATVILSDHTRPVPSRHIVPFILKELREGNPDIDITLLIATGFHRPTTREELVGKLGEEIVDNEKIVVHDSQDDDANVELGILPSGAPLVIDKVAANADLIVSEGFIEPHFFAGFSGGRKSILPGVCSKTTVLGNHCSAFIDSPYARTGILDGNPIHKDMLAACEIAGLQYIVNVVIDGEKKAVAAFAGNPVTAHRQGCDFIKDYCRVKPAAKGDIVITSNGGYPLDQNVYQSVKGLTAAEAAAKDDGVLIISSACNDGSGGEGFYQALKNCSSARELQEEILKIPMDQTQPDQWEYQIMSRILSNHRVIFVSDPAQQEMIENMKLEYAPDLETALKQAAADKADPHVVIIPDGVSVITEA